MSLSKRRSYYSSDAIDKEQNKHTIGITIAISTDVTVAAAQASVVVIRLTSHGRDTTTHEKLATVKFRLFSKAFC